MLIPFRVVPERGEEDGDNLRLGLLLPLTNTAADDLLESEAKVFGEKCIYAWIKCTVAVAEPEKDGEDERRDALLTKGSPDVHDKEWEPADNEPTHDYTWRDPNQI